MIHGDLHLSNFIKTPDKLYLIDYDDCGYGWFLYECGCTLMQYNDPLEELSQSWIRGYTGIRNLSDKDLEMIPVFILMRRIARIGWMASHSSSDTAASVSDFRTYIEVTIDHASALFTAS
jgi:Ser/Thr protein kinase RdoA (MazF antagonist)